jgi:hypothetical protein
MTGSGLWLRRVVFCLALGGTALLAACNATGETEVASTGSCPEGFGWAEGLPGHFAPDAPFPTKFSADADDCLFQQWSWEAFAWATAMIDGQPRFMSLKTMDDLDPEGAAAPAGVLRLTAGIRTADGRVIRARDLRFEDRAARVRLYEDCSALPSGEGDAIKPYFMLEVSVYQPRRPALRFPAYAMHSLVRLCPDGRGPGPRGRPRRSSHGNIPRGRPRLLPLPRTPRRHHRLHGGG